MSGPGLSIRGGWRPLVDEEVEQLPGCPGVYEIAEPDGQVLKIGIAGGRSLFGLRGELRTELASSDEPGRRFRAEQNMQYISRWKELMMVHRRDRGSLPSGSDPADEAVLGRLGPTRDGGRT